MVSETCLCLLSSSLAHESTTLNYMYLSPDIQFSQGGSVRPQTLASGAREGWKMYIYSSITARGLLIMPFNGFHV